MRKMILTTFWWISLLSVSPQCFAQNSSAKEVPSKIIHVDTPIEELLSTPQDWRSFSAHIVPNSKVSMTFRLKTSWIPGPDHKGMLRYQLTGAPDIYATLKNPSEYPEVATPERIESFIKRAGNHQIQMTFYDEDEFVTRKIPIDFMFAVGEDGHITSLIANDSMEMEKEEYKKLLLGGSWQIIWSVKGREDQSN